MRSLPFRGRGGLGWRGTSGGAQCERGLGSSQRWQWAGEDECDSTIWSQVSLGDVPEEVSVYSSVRWVNSSFPAYLLRIWETGVWGKSKSYRCQRVPILPPPTRSSPSTPKLPICPPHPPRPRSFPTARLNVNTQGELQGKHTADKNLMLYVTKQNEYLIRAFMRNHITNRPHVAARATRPLPAGAAPARQRSS